VTPPQKPGVGILGGGQLAWMLAQAAAELGIDLHVQTPNPDDPAASLAASVVVAPLNDIDATRRLASRCEAISFENEWIPLDALELLRTEGIRFLPDLDALRPLVSKRGQRELLNRLALPCPRWCPLEAVFPPQRPPRPFPIRVRSHPSGGSPRPVSNPLGPSRRPLSRAFPPLPSCRRDSFFP